MKKTVGVFLMFFTCFLLVGLNWAGGDSEGPLAMKSFSVNAPRGWTVERAGDDRVVFRTAEPRSGEAVIVVAADAVPVPDGREDEWRQTRSAAAYRNGVVDEGEVRAPGGTWRKIVYGDEIGGTKLRCAALVFQQGGTRCLIRFSCPENRFDAMVPYLDAVRESVALAAGTRT
ncbi:MAG: hypothetical protein ACM3NF_00880 [Gemmatimonadota bacterium]